MGELNSFANVNLIDSNESFVKMFLQYVFHILWIGKLLQY